METLQIFLSICGGISIVGGAVAVIIKWVSPAFKLNKRVETLEEHDKRDYEVMKKISDRDALIMETLITMLDNQLSGGSNIDELKKTRDKLTNYLLQNQG